VPVANGESGSDDGEDAEMREVRIYVEESKCEPLSLGRWARPQLYLGIYACRAACNDSGLTSPVQPLFNALSFCSALHDSLLPNGQTSTFPFFDNDDEDDNDAWEDGDARMNGEGGGEAGRVRSDFHSGGGPAARFRPY
jgi:hypothetical protein